MPRRQYKNPGTRNEELFRVLERLPNIAHDDEVDARSGYGVSLDWLYRGDPAMLPHHLPIEIALIEAERKS